MLISKVSWRAFIPSKGPLGRGPTTRSSQRPLTQVPAGQSVLLVHRLPAAIANSMILNPVGVMRGSADAPLPAGASVKRVDVAVTPVSQVPLLGISAVFADVAQQPPPPSVQTAVIMPGVVGAAVVR